MTGRLCPGASRRRRRRWPCRVPIAASPRQMIVWSSSTESFQVPNITPPIWRTCRNGRREALMLGSWPRCRSDHTHVVSSRPAGRPGASRRVAFASAAASRECPAGRRAGRPAGSARPRAPARTQLVVPRGSSPKHKRPRPARLRRSGRRLARQGPSRQAKTLSFPATWSGWRRQIG